MQLDTLYQDIILDHYKHPHRRGLREPYDAEVHHVNPTCGDEVTLRVRVADGRVEDVSYEGQGCSISQASTSMLTDLVVGKPVQEALAVHDAFLGMMQAKGVPDAAAEETLEDAVAFGGVSRYPSRVRCALLGWMAWKDATARAVAGGGGAAAESAGGPAGAAGAGPDGGAAAGAGGGMAGRGSGDDGLVERVEGGVR